MNITNLASPQHGPFGKQPVSHHITPRVDWIEKAAIDWCKARGMTSHRWHGRNGLAAFARAVVGMSKGRSGM